MSDRFHIDRRNFVKLSLVGSAGAAAVACAPNASKVAPLLVVDEMIPTGVAFWSRGICAQCEGGCGVLVKRMDAEVPVEINGQAFRQHRLVAKKLEGNPDHPISRGALCARGQASLETVYHPERLRFPLSSAGTRGSGDYQRLSWDRAIATLTAKLHAAGRSVLWIGRRLSGTEAELVDSLLESVGGRRLEYRPFASPLAESSVDAVLPLALAEADYILSFGNFLELWPNQVAATRAYGEFRRNRRRGIFTQLEPRMSLTASNADRWIPIRPGTEGVVASALAAFVRQDAGADAAVVRAAQISDVPAQTLTGLAREFDAASHRVVIGGPNVYAYMHGAQIASAIEDLRRASGSTVTRTAPAALPSFSHPLPPRPEVLIVHDVNPLFSGPPSWGVEQWLQSVPFVANLGFFADETALRSDLILPLSTSLESWVDEEFELPGGIVGYSLNAPAMKPMHDTRSLLETALLATKPGAPSAAAGNDAEQAIRDRWQRLHRAPDFEQFWQDAVARGGYWGPAAPPRPPASARTQPNRRVSAVTPTNMASSAVEFTGNDRDYPYFLRVYESPVLGDGRCAHLSWLQELPDPITSAMWSSWIELHPQTAAKLNVKNGDGVLVESTAGKIELPAFIYPGIRIDTVAIAAGQGHSSARAQTARHGANVYQLLSGAVEPSRGGLAWESMRVRLSKTGKEMPLTLFGRSLRIGEEGKR